MEKAQRWSLRMNLFLGGVSMALLVVGIVLLAHPTSAYAQAGGTGEPGAAAAKAPGFAFISAAVSVGLSCIAAGIAVGAVGAAAMGAVAERPELMGRSLIYVGLAEGIAIYGLIVAIIILGKV